jgi:hypothetical protein
VHLVEWLFEELAASKPKKVVHPSVIKLAGGMCLGLIWGRMEGSDSSLTDLLAIVHTPTQCGIKLVAFMKALSDEALQNPERGVSDSRIIELMVAALHSPDICIREESDGQYIVSTMAFQAQRNIKVRVRLTKSRAVDWEEW